MSRHELKNTFTRGIITPLAWARDDIELYKKSAEDLLNYHVLKEGGVRRRSGSRYRGRAKYGGKTTRLIPFVFSRAQSYALEFGDAYMRPWTSFGNVLDGGGLTYEIVSPYAEADVPNIMSVRTNDVLYVACKGKKQQKLKRLAHANWAFADIDFIDGPYLPINDQNNALTTSAALTTGSSVTFTWASTANLNTGTGLVATDVGRMVRAQFGGKWSWGVITAVGSTTTATVLIKEGNGGGGAGSDLLALGGAHLITGLISAAIEIGAGNKSVYSSYSWRLGAFSDTTGYPRAVTMFQGRVFWGSTTANPRAVWYSRSNYPEVMSPSDVDGTVVESHGGMLEVQGAQGSEIMWLQEAPRLQIGMDAAIRSLGASNSDEGFGPRNVSQRVEVGQGTEAITPAVVGPSSVHLGLFGKALNDLYFDYQANSMVAPELSVVSDHLFKSGGREIAFQQEPNNTLWCILNDGTMVATTVERYEKVIGFSRHILADAAVKSICSIPGVSQDEVYLVTRRTVNSVVEQYIETLDPLFDPDTMVKPDAFLVDCGATYVGAATATVTGIDWLKGQIVDILADGHALPRVTVSTGGILTLPNGETASKISFGKPITASGRTLRSPSNLPDGHGLGRPVRVVTATADVYGALGLAFRSDVGQLDKLRPKTGADPYTTATGLMYDTHTILIDGSWSSGGRIWWESIFPLPATIRAINVQLETV